jgi:hypothetical protein
MPKDAKPSSLANIAFDSGVIMERTRIINLLTEKYMELVKANRWDDSNYYLHTIALIKGEIK